MEIGSAQFKAFHMNPISFSQIFTKEIDPGPMIGICGEGLEGVEQKHLLPVCCGNCNSLSSHLLVQQYQSQ